MGKAKGPRPGIDRDGIETRQINVHHKGLEPPSSVTLYFYCPFCRDEVKAYLWSLSGGGKRCGCGAFFYSRGRATHFTAAATELDLKHG